MKKAKNREYLNGLSVWSLSLGGIIGWGCFILPGSRFLPDAGPVGSILGILAATCFALIVCSNYSTMVRQYPEIGGSYVYTRHIMGEDHAFLAVWCLILAYLSLLWANATAFALMIRYVVGDALQWGFHYRIAGYDVYLGEVLTTIAVLVLLGLLTAYRCRLANLLRMIFAVSLLVSVVIIFALVVARNGISLSFTSAFSSVDTPGTQILNVFILAPWMFVGFETVTHAVGESKFSVSKIFTYSAIAVICGMLIYVFFTIVAGSTPDTGVQGWDAIAHGSLPKNGTGIEDIPVFANAIHAIGPWGTKLLIVATMSAILSSVLVFYRSASRVIRITAEYDLLPKRFAQVSEDGVPIKAVLLTIALSIPIPFLGRAVIGWNADVSTLTVAVVYAYISVCTFRTMPKRSARRLCGILGVILSLSILVLLLIPNVFADNTLSTESYFMLSIWSLLGILYYWHVFSRDRKNRFGKSTVMWLIMLLLLFFSTNVWTRLIAEGRLKDISGMDKDTLNPVLRTSSIIQFTVICIALLILLSLFRKVVARQKEADMQALRAQEQDKAKSTFLSNISHDIRTPMNAIVGMTDILLREDLPEHAHEYVQDINNSGEHLLTLINDILDFSKIESGKMEIEEKDYEFTDLLREQSVLFLNHIGGKPVELIYDITPDIPTKMRGDVKRITQVMTNIVGNAAKYTDYGFVRIQIEIMDRDEEKIELMISVYDSGRGIREEDFDRIFRSFSQVDTKKNRSIEGTGLGLAISKELIELMGGEIHVESEYGKGSRFYFNLTQKIIDDTPASNMDPSYVEMKGAYYLDNPYEKRNFDRLAETLGLNITPIQDRDGLSGSDFDYFLTDVFDLAKYVHQNFEGKCRVAYLQNPMLRKRPSEEFAYINKPIYFKNMCAFLSGEILDRSVGNIQAFFTAPEARVLIVDDMPMNQKVVSELIRPLEITIDSAMNGKEALDYIYNNSYDMVFMDHMMPVMDGIEAILELRGRAEYDDLPVIALTANATTEAQRLFEESGFSGFLSKPVHFEEIVGCIREWLPEGKIHETSVSLASVSENIMAVQAGEDLDVDIPGINTDKGVLNSGSPTLFTELLGEVYELIDSKCTSINGHLEEGDIKAYTTEVHAMKTTCRMIGAMELAENFYTLEKLGSDENVDKIREYTPSVLADLTALKPYLKPYVEEKSTPDKEYDSAAVETILDDLKTAIDDFDLTLAEECTKQLESFRFEGEMKDQMEKLFELVSDLDYDEAGELLNEIRQ